MYSQDLESSVLRLAQGRGLLDGATADELDAGLLRDAEALSRSSCFGPRLDGLLAKGVLDQKVVEALVWEVVLGVMPKETQAPEAKTAIGSDQVVEPEFPHRFIDLEPLGEGAFAKVYKAFDPQLQRWVALKVLKTTHPAQSEILLAEARAQAKVEHPNVCRVHEVGRMGEHGYILMELARGATLAHEMDALDPDAKVRILRDVAEGIHAAHRQGLIHLDIKPGNILLQPAEDGSYRPLITDFGMVRNEQLGGTNPHCPMGTPPYSSPEQIGGRFDLIDRRSDIYSLGVTLYVALCGAFPFDAADFPALVEAIQHKVHVPLRHQDPKAPRDLEAIIEICMARDPRKRYPSALALADDLQCCLAGEPVQALQGSGFYRLGKWMRRHRLSTATLLLAALVCMAIALLGLSAIYRLKTQTRLAKAFQGEADQIELLLRNAHGMPFHDITPEMAQVRARMDKVRTLMDKEGETAQGPGSYALGRAYLALGDPEAAVTQLRHAWDAGFRGPETAAVLGEALGRAYLQKVVEHAGLRPFDVNDPFSSGATMQDAILDRLKKAYADPSQSFLEKGREALDPERRILVEGLEALHEDQPEKTIEQARSMERMAPWDSEAWLLESTANLDMASHDIAGGRLQEAGADLGRMETAIGRAKDLARSSPAVFEAETQRQYFELCIKVLLRQATGQDLERTLQASELNLKVDPLDARAYALRAAIQLLWSQRMQEAGQDPRPRIRMATQECETALRLKPDSVWALSLEAMSLTHACALSRRFYGEDDRPDALRSLEIYKRLLSLTGFEDQISYSMGFSQTQLGLYEASRGEPEADADLEAAARNYLHSAGLSHNPEVYFQLGTPYRWRGLLAFWRGENPSPFYDQAIGAYRQSLALAPSVDHTWGRLADLLVLRGEWRLLSGGDPTTDIKAAEEASRTCIGLNRDLYLGHINLAETALLQARWNTKRGIASFRELQLAEHELNETRKWSSSDPELMRDFGILEREKLRWAVASGGPLEPALSKGLRFVDETMRLNHYHAQAQVLKAELFLLAARRSGPHVRQWRLEAGQALVQACALNPAVRQETEGVLRERE